jgi:hypothetical protein
MMVGESMSVYALVVCSTRILAVGGSANNSLSPVSCRNFNKNTYLEKLIETCFPIFYNTRRYDRFMSVHFCIMTSAVTYTSL